MFRYYESDDSIKQDFELQSFVNQVSADGTSPNGGKVNWLVLSRTQTDHLTSYHVNQISISTKTQNQDSREVLRNICIVIIKKSVENINYILCCLFFLFLVFLLLSAVAVVVIDEVFAFFGVFSYLYLAFCL